MRISSVKGIQYKDGLAKKRRQRFIIKIWVAVVVVFIVIGILVYATFYTGWFDLKDYEITGTNNLDPEIIRENLDTYRDYRFLNLLPVGRNILFFNSEGVKQDILNNNDLLKTIKIEKKYFHALSVGVVERESIGVWCFERYVGEHKCKYFDDEMKTWGNLDKSSGFVLLTVEDLETIDSQIINPVYFEAVKGLINGLRGIVTINTIQIPTNTIGDMSVIINKPYILKFSVDSNISAQAEVLRVFLNSKKDDETFAPQYLDLRVDGRVYYK